MTEIMETNPWQVWHSLYKISEFVRQAIRLLWFSILTAAHQGVTRLWRIPSRSNSSACSRFNRRSSSTAKAGMVMARVRSVFGALNLNTRLGLFEAFHHTKRAAVEIDILPS